VDQHAPPSQGTASASPGTITIKIPVGVAKLGHNPLVVAAVSGAVGGLLGGALKSVIENNWDFLQTNNQTNGYLLFGFLGIFAAVPIGLVVASWNSWRAGSRKIQPDARRAAVFAAVGGYVGFAIGAYVFSQLTNTGNDPYNGLHYYIGRMLAFSIIGAAVGAALAASYGLKSRRVLNGLIGGAVGGAVSGLALQFVSAVLWNPMPKWVFDIAYVLPVGIGIAVGTVVVERVLRSSWVRITAGPMSGKEFTLFKPETRIGSDYRCDIVMARDPGVRPFHAAFLRDGTGKVTVAPFEGAQLNINGMPSEGGELRNLDAVVIGGSVLTYQEKAVAQ
jgi:MFS family permease